jgi:hypothetical protein
MIKVACLPMFESWKLVEELKVCQLKSFDNKEVKIYNRLKKLLA